MARKNIQITRTPPRRLTSIDIRDGIHPISSLDSRANRNNRYNVIVRGDVGTTYVIAETGRILSSLTTNVQTIPAEGFRTYNLVVSESTRTNVREGSVTVTNSASGLTQVLTKGLEQAGVQGLGLDLSISKATPLPGENITITANVAGGDSPYFYQFSTTEDFSTGVTRVPSTGTTLDVSGEHSFNTRSFDKSNLDNNTVTWYARATGSSGMVPVGEVSYTVVPPSIMGDTLFTIPWDKGFASSELTTTDLGGGTFILARTNGSGTATMVNANNKSTLTITGLSTNTSIINSVTNAYTISFRLNSVTSLLEEGVGVVKSPRPEISVSFPNGDITIPYGDNTEAFVIEYDIANAGVRLEDANTADDDIFVQSLLDSVTFTARSAARTGTYATESPSIPSITGPYAVRVTASIRGTSSHLGRRPQIDDITVITI